MSQLTEQEVRDWLINKLSKLVGVPTDEIDTAAPFADYGLDSRQAVGLAGDLEKWLKREIDPTLVWDYPSIDQVTAALLSPEPSAGTND